MKLALKLTGISTALLVASTSANAIVTSWDYTVSSLFTSAGYTIGSPSPVSTTTLSWGTPTGPGGQSSLSINGSPTMGSVDTYLGVTPPAVVPYLGTSTSLTHVNRPITGVSLTSAIITNTITLNPTNPDNPALAPFNLLFPIAFTETPNSNPCADMGSPTPCNDIFVLTSGLTNTPFDYDDGTGISTYFLNIFPTIDNILSTLPDSVCVAAGVANDCLGFTTAENQMTVLPFSFTISTERLRLEEIPEPGTLALFGLGLLSLLAKRSRQRR